MPGFWIGDSFSQSMRESGYFYINIGHPAVRYFRLPILRIPSYLFRRRSRVLRKPVPTGVPCSPGSSSPPTSRPIRKNRLVHRRDPGDRGPPPPPCAEGRARRTRTFDSHAIGKRISEAHPQLGTLRAGVEREDLPVRVRSEQIIPSPG